MLNTSQFNTAQLNAISSLPSKTAYLTGQTTRDVTPLAYLTGQTTRDIVSANALSSANDITAFIIPNQTGANINATNHTVTVNMPYGTTVTALTPTITVSTGATIAPTSGAAENFSSPVSYTVTAQDGSTQVWVVSVVVALNSATDITAFSINGANGTINATNHTISLALPAGTAVTALVPTITLSTGASISPTSGVSQDFTSPVTYTVTAQDGVTTQAWVVSVSVASYVWPVSCAASVSTRGVYLTVNGQTTNISVLAGSQVKLSMLFTDETGAAVDPPNGVQILIYDQTRTVIDTIPGTSITKLATGSYEAWYQTSDAQPIQPFLDAEADGTWPEGVSVDRKHIVLNWTD